jgi:hypothetical protein
VGDAACCYEYSEQNNYWAIWGFRFLVLDHILANWDQNKGEYDEAI